MTVGPPMTAGQAGGPIAGASAGQAAIGGAGGQAGEAMPPGMAGSGGSPDLAGSGGSAGAGGSAGMMGAPAAGSGGMAGMTGMAGMAGGMASAGEGGSGGSSVPPGEVCELWTSSQSNADIGWTGSVAGCEPGDISEQARMAALKLVNMYRAMAGLPPVEMTAEGNRLAQACALLMTANNRLSHSPDQSWTCYTAEAANAAGSSSLSSGTAISTVHGYMIDPGNQTTLGHRRWILSNMLAGIGFGSTNSFSCQYQPARRPPAGSKPWVAWPPPGQVPFQSFGSRFATIDQTGWSVQSDSIDFSNAQVTVSSGGMDLPVTATPLARGYGSTYALRILPMGWTTAAGRTYSVKISGTSMPIEYDVEVVDCQ